MRVLHVSAYYAPAFVYGGPPRSIHALCRSLGQTGLVVHVFTTDANGSGELPRDVAGQSTFDGVPVRYFPRSFPRSPIGSRALADALRREIAAYDLVHVHGLWNRVVWAAAREARRAGVPYVLSPRGMLQGAARAHRAWRKHAGWALMDRRVAFGAAALHATSEPEAETLARLGADIPVVCVPNGVDLAPMRANRQAAGAHVVFVGRIHPIKRLDLLIDAFALVRERHASARLVIAGPDETGARAELTARAGRHADAIEWTGAVDETRRARLLAEATALVMCSDSESFGMAALEAMAAAVPVVVTKTCPWSDVERHGAGFWVDQDAHAIAAALERLVTEPQLAAGMGSRAQALVEAKYAWPSIARTMANHYETIVLRAGSRLQLTS